MGRVKKQGDVSNSSNSKQTSVHKKSVSTVAKKKLKDKCIPGKLVGVMDMVVSLATEIKEIKLKERLGLLKLKADESAPTKSSASGASTQIAVNAIEEIDIVSDSDDAESVITIASNSDVLTKQGKAKVCNNENSFSANRDNESFITIDETSFFKPNVIEIDDSDKSVMYMPKIRRPSIIIDDPNKNATGSPSTSRLMKKRKILPTSTAVGSTPQKLENEISCLAHFHRKRTVPVVPSSSSSTFSPLVNMRRHSGRYFMDKTSTPVRQAAGKVTKRARMFHHTQQGAGQGKRRRDQALRHHAPSNEDPNCFWGPAVRNPDTSLSELRPSQAVESLRRREIVVDGQNVAYGHGGGRSNFSPYGIELCVKYFEGRGHKVVVFLPNSCMGLDKNGILKGLENRKVIAYTPSRKVEGMRLQPYDDRYIIQYASQVGGVVVSRDQFRDLLGENPGFRETIVERLLMFTFVGDIVMFPEDPLGPGGPTLDRFLRFPPTASTTHTSFEPGTLPPSSQSQPPASSGSPGPTALEPQTPKSKSPKNKKKKKKNKGQQNSFSPKAPENLSSDPPRSPSTVQVTVHTNDMARRVKLTGSSSGQVPCVTVTTITN